MGETRMIKPVTIYFHEEDSRGGWSSIYYFFGDKHNHGVKNCGWPYGVFYSFIFVLFFVVVCST